MEVIGGHWRTLEVIDQIDQVDQIDQIDQIVSQWTGRLHSYMWMDGIGWMDGMDGWLSQVVGS